jgi:hypothetical protein
VPQRLLLSVACAAAALPSASACRTRGTPDSVDQPAWPSRVASRAREIEQLGYLGKGSSVRWMIARWRPPKTPCQPKRRLLTRHAPWLLLRAPDLLKEEERADLKRVLAADGLVAAGYRLVQRFRDALHDLDVIAFKQWLIARQQVT